MPTARAALLKVCRFISHDWADYWFTDQLYNENDFHNLSEILKAYKKAQNVFGKSLEATAIRSQCTKK
jgi:hypothetical protein